MAKPPRPEVREWLGRLLMRGESKFLNVDDPRAIQALAPIAGMLTLVGTPADPDAQLTFDSFGTLVFGRLSKRWKLAGDLADVIPADREVILSLARAVQTYERIAATGGVISFSRADAVNLPGVVGNMLRVCTHMDTFLEEVAPLRWCAHPNVVFSDKTMDKIARQLRGLLGDIHELRDDDFGDVPRA